MTPNAKYKPYDYHLNMTGLESEGVRVAQVHNEAVVAGEKGYIRGRGVGGRGVGE